MFEEIQVYTEILSKICKYGENHYKSLRSSFPTAVYESSFVIITNKYVGVEDEVNSLSIAHLVLKGHLRVSQKRAYWELTNPIHIQLFSKQCSRVRNNSILPNFSYITNERLSNVQWYNGNN